MTAYPLHRWLLATTAVLMVLNPSDLRAASTATRGYASSLFRVEIDGASCASVQKYEGGDLRATVVVEGATGGALPKKHIASPACAPLVLTLGIPFDPVIAAWINDLCANGKARKTVQILEYDYDMQFRAGVESDNTALVEVDFPAFDASDKSPALLTLVLAPGSTQPLTSDPSTTATYAGISRPAQVTVSNFTVAIDGLITTYVSRIEPITIKRSSGGDATGSGHSIAKSPPTTEFSNLIASVAAMDATTWQTWFNDFVVNGNSGDTQEKNGTLTINDTTGKAVFTLQFSHLGMVRLSPAPYDASSETIRRDQAEMYYETLTLAAGGAAAGTSSSGSSTATGATSTAPASSTAAPGSSTTPSLTGTPPSASTLSPVGTPVGPATAGTPTLVSPTSPATLTAATPVQGSATAVSAVPGLAPTSTLTPSTVPPPAPVTTLSPAAATSAAMTPVGPAPAPGTPLPMPSAPGVPPAPPSPTALAPTAASGTISPAASTAAVAPTPSSPGAPATPAALTPSITPPSFAPVAATPGAVSAATPIAAASTDQTAAALANFPVLSGATRTWFSSSRGKSTWQERANYTAAVAPDSAVTSYAQQLAAAGWDEISRSESGDAATLTHQFTVDLRKDQTSAHVILAQNQKQGTNLTVTLSTQFPGSSAPALTAGFTAAPATGAATSASDRGARDPADFPRLPGSVRASFTSTGQKTSSQEVATYTAKCSPAAGDAFYTQSLPGAGWDEITRYETADDQAKSDQISTTWQNASRSATLALSGSSAGGANIRVAVTTQVSGTP